MKQFLRRTWHRIRRRSHFDSVRFVQSRQDVPVKPGSILYIVGMKPNWKWVIMDCPCRCGQRIDVNLMQNRYPAWLLKESKKEITLEPSLWVSDCPIRSH